MFAAATGVLLALNWLGIFKMFFGIDTAFITLMAGYETFYNSISALLEHRISADVVLCVAVVAAIAVGRYQAAAEAMFIVLVGEGLESYAAGRTEAAIQRFVQQLPHRARRFIGFGRAAARMMGGTNRSSGLNLRRELFLPSPWSSRLAVPCVVQCFTN